MFDVKKYVLGNDHGGIRWLFISGSDPRMIQPVPEPVMANQLPSPDAALDFRLQMPHMLGGIDKWKVYELAPDGGLIPVA